MADPQRDDSPGFTFVDKRRRGEQAEAVPEPAREAPPRPAPPRDVASREVSGRDASRDSARDVARGPAPGPSPLDAGGPMQANLTSLCAMFYSEALVHMGQVPDPATGRPHVDLEQARFTIDMLSMIRDKTEGNRTEEESAVLEEILAALRMGFVQLSRRR